MAKDWAIVFYKTTAWKKLRTHIFTRDVGLCQCCLEKSIIKNGDEVHHKIELTPSNINDAAISLNEDNLILLCKECHNQKHKRFKTTSITLDGISINDDGDLVEVPPKK